MTVYEKAASIFRNQSLDNFNIANKENIHDYHNNAVEKLKNKGYSHKAIEEAF